MKKEIGRKVMMGLLPILFAFAIVSLGAMTANAAPCTHYKTMKYERAIDAKCETPGHVKGYTCTKCNKHFWDKYGYNEIKDKYWIIEALGHDHKVVEGSAVEASCLADGKEADKKCSRCEDVIEGAVIESLGHDYQLVEGSAVDATCLADGKEADKKCTRCEDVIEGAVIESLGHDYQLVEGSAVDASCEVDGKEADKKCSRCEDVIVGAVIESLGHDHQLVEGSAVDATCLADGKEADKKCSRCEDVIEGEVLEAHGHSHQTVHSSAAAATCMLDGKHADMECEHCDDVILGAKINAHGHKWNAGKVTKAATEKATGVKMFTCTTCGDTRKETIPKLKPAPTPAKPKVSGTAIAKMTAKGKTSLVIGWTKINGVDGYDIFFAKCNHGAKTISCKNIKSIKGNKTFAWTKTGLKAGTSYKAYVKAYVMKNGKKSYVRISPVVHAFTGGYTKTHTNSKGLNVKKTSVTLKKGKTYKISASVNKLKNNRKIMPSDHTATIRYLTSNSKIATVNGSGKVSAKGKGTCYIYVYTHNGMHKKVKITVK